MESTQTKYDDDFPNIQSKTVKIIIKLKLFLGQTDVFNTKTDAFIICIRKISHSIYKQDK